MKGKILIAGAIGTFDFNGKMIQGVELLDVVSNVTSLGDIDELEVEIASNGGRKDVGDNIYNYLLSLKSKMKVTTIQVGDIASIATKIFGAGDERIATHGYEFMVHNPWTVAQGDSNALAQVSNELKAEENELKTFYMNLTGISEEGLTPLLNSETTFDADTALKLKFATKVREQLKLVAMKLETKKKLSGIFNQFLSWMNQNPILNMVVELEGGAKIALGTEDASKLEGVPAFTVDESGEPSQEPAPDGEYKLADGRTITVSQGVVATVTGGEPAPDDTQVEAVLNAKLDKLTDILSKLPNIKEELTAMIDEKFVEIKASIGTTHTPMAYKKENHQDLVAEWERSFKANEHFAMKRNDPEKYKALYFAKYGKMPNI